MTKLEKPGACGRSGKGRNQQAASLLWPMTSASIQSRLASAFPGIVLRMLELDPELPGEMIEVFMVPDDRLAEFQELGEALSIERVQAGGEPVVLMAHTVSWTKTNAPAMAREGPPAGA
jgi:hypothetical protein